MKTNGSPVKCDPRPLEVHKRKVLVLTVLSGEDIGREYVLSKEDTILGCGDDSDIVLRDKLISPHHTRLEIKRSSHGPDELVLTALDSVHGTFLNFEPVSRALLKDGDKIMLGATILKIERKDIYDQNLLDELIKLATLDDLTGLYNKRQIITLGEEEFARSLRYRRPFSLIVLEIDQLADIYESYGPAVRDWVLKRWGAALLSMTRQQDKVGRYGIEEFLVMLPETRTVEARIVAERVDAHARSLHFTHRDQNFGISVSMGISSRAERRGELFAHIVERADQALYLAKRNGNGLIAVREGTPDPTADSDYEKIPADQLP